MILLLACATPTPTATPAPALFPDGVPVAIAPVPGLATLSAQTCGGCHPTEYATWSASKHAHAWEARPEERTGPSFRAAMSAVGDTPVCAGCHLPLQVQHETTTDGFVDGDLTRPRRSPNPAFDASLMTEGVTCAACHVRDGVVLSANPPGNAPHPTRQSAELTSADLCATCHQLAWPEADRPFYDTWGEWSRAGFDSAGVTCRACHMPERDGRPDHGMALGATRALTAMVTVPTTRPSGGAPFAVSAEVLNTGAGHAVPTGNPWHRWSLVFVLVDAAGAERTRGPETVLARTIEEAPPWKTTADTRLEPTKSVTLRADLVVPPDLGQGAVELRARTPQGETVLRRVPIAPR